MRIKVRHIRWFEPVIGGDMVDDLATLIAQWRVFHGGLADPPLERIGRHEALSAEHTGSRSASISSSSKAAAMIDGLRSRMGLIPDHRRILSACASSVGGKGRPMLVAVPALSVK